MKGIYRFNCSGIYCIMNTINDKMYIGSSKNIYQRLQHHFSLLKHNKHENAHLQNSWNKYGASIFDCYPLELCAEEKLLEREQYYIDSMKPEYNINQETQRPPCTESSRKKQSETRKRLFAEGKLTVNIPKQCKTYVYNLDGSFYGEYDSMKAAALDLFGYNSGAVRSACYGIQNPSHRIHNYMFYLEPQENLNAYVKHKRKYDNPKKRQQLLVESDDMIYIAQGGQDAANFIGCSLVAVGKNVDKNTKIFNKYLVKRLPCK